MSFTYSQEEVLQALQALLNAKDLAESQRIVEIHADFLLTDAAEQLLTEILQHYAGDA